MLCRKRFGKINVKVLTILVLVMVAAGLSLIAVRQIRRSIFVKMSLTAGQAAFDKQDWPAACTNFQEYLGRKPDDVEILKKYAKARLAMRPLDAANMIEAIAAYRRIIQLAPLDDVAYEKLASLYAYVGNFEELGHVARTRLQHDPNNLRAPLWQAEAFMRLNKNQEAQEKLLQFLQELDDLPEKPVEYVQACLAMSQIAVTDGSVEGLEWLNKALTHAPDSAEALVQRAQFYRKMQGSLSLSPDEASALARTDLEAADAAGTEDPQVRCLMGWEWLAQGDLDRAAAEVQRVDSLPQDKLEERFLTIEDWKVARFLLVSELAMQKEAATERVSLADEAVASLTDKKLRVQILPSAVLLYATAGKVAEARKCLDEYLDAQHGQYGTSKSLGKLAYLRAVVAQAEGNPYAVIDIMQPAVVADASRPELWQLLAGAYSETDQPRRAATALAQALRLRPRDAQNAMKLAREYMKLQDWDKAFETARLAEALDSAHVEPRLLRIEAGICIAAEQGSPATQASLPELSDELAGLRAEHPDRLDIRTLQAMIASSLGRPDKAEEELKLAIAECREPLGAELQLARHYYRNNRMADAIEVAKAACDRHSDVAEPWLSLAALYMAQADQDLARNCLKQGISAVTAGQEKRSLWIRLALLELTHGDRVAGVAILKELAAQDKQEVYARTLLLSVREIQRDQAAAQELIEELRRAEGGSGLMWRLHQASLWLSDENWRAKQKDIADLLQYCIDADPEWPAPVLLMVNMYGRLEDFRRVEDICRQALARNPSATEIVDRLIALFEKQGRFSDAEQILQQRGTDARMASAWHVRMALREGDVSRAIDELRLRASNDDRDADSRILLARLIYRQTRDVHEAFSYLKEAEAIASDSLTLVAARVSILHAEGQTEAAQRILDECVANRDDFGAYWMRAIYLAEQGRLDRAEADYRKLTTFANEGATGYILLSNFYRACKEHDKAVAALEEGLSAHANDLRIQRALMKLLFARGQEQDRRRGLDILSNLEEQMPEDLELIRLRAAQLLQQSTPESLPAAREKLELIVKLEPTSVDAHLGLIGIAMKNEDYAGARDYAIRASGSNPDDPALLCARGRAELALKNIEMAVQLARLGLARDPNSVEARDLFVEAALKGGDRRLLGDAGTLVETWVRRDPANETLLIARARVLTSLGTPLKAIPELEAYCRTNQGSASVPACVMLADLYRLSGDVDKARQKIDQAKSMEPNNQRVIHAWFLWLLAQERFSDLEGISADYISAEKQDPMMVLTAGSALAASSSMTLKKEGIVLLEHAAALSPTSAKAHLSLASALYQIGEIERAEQVYRQLLSHYPANIQALNDLAWILQEHDRDYVAALELVNTGLRLAHDEPHLLDTRGTILANMQDRLVEARDDFQRLTELSPSGSREKARAALKLGRICVKLNDLAAAKQHLDEALKIDEETNVFTPAERSEISDILLGRDPTAVP